MTDAFLPPEVVPNTPATIPLDPTPEKPLCSKCGQPVDLPEGFILPEGIEAAHAAGTCPPEQSRHYRARIILERFETIPGETEEGEVLAIVGQTVKAESFMIALPTIANAVSDKWQKLIEHAEVVEADEAADAPE